MANISTPRPAPFGAVAISNVVRFLSNTISTVTAPSRAAKTRKTLSALSNRQLEDIGLAPGDIHSLAHRVTLLH